jgi:3-deoxy-D-manno-octulosonic acid (KDO) 8-phosphate synthase
MEVHPNPDAALSDGPNQVPLSQVKELIRQCLKIHQVWQSLPELCLPEQGKCGQSAIVY